MTILLNGVWFPASEGSKVGKAFADWLKENPQDKSVIKMLSIAVSSTDDGQILIYGLDNIMNGKDKEALLYSFLEEFLFLLDAEDFIVDKIKKIKIEIKGKKFELQAEAFGDRASEYKFTNDVKAVTYNQMFVKKEKDKYVVQVVLDV